MHHSKRKHLGLTIIKTFLSKNLRKGIIKRSKLKNLFSNSKNEESWCKYKIQRNNSVNLLYETQKQYYKN